jgi:hypothetical protein
MPSTDRNLELKAKTSVAQTASQAAVYAKGLNKKIISDCTEGTACVRLKAQTVNAVQRNNW